MFQRKFKLSSAENALIFALITEAKVRELGQKASAIRVRFVPASRRYVVRKYSAIEIARRAQQRAADRWKLEEERMNS